MDPARIDQVNLIIESYLQTLGSVSSLLAFGVPDTLLAHGRDEIRLAIRDWLSNNASVNTVFDLHQLRLAYQSLASFLPYDEANAAARLRHAFECGDYAYLTSPAAEAATRLSRHIEQEASRLAVEFDTLLSMGQTDPLLAEVDAFLSQFSRKPTTPTG